jgi:ribosome-associated protein
MQIEELKDLVIAALEELKAVDIKVLDVEGKASFTDRMIIASGTSSRHVKSVADNVVMRAKEKGVELLGMEGETTGEWILVDLGDVVVHVMQPEIRDFYNLEKLWTVEEGMDAAAEDAAAERSAERKS